MSTVIKHFPSWKFVASRSCSCNLNYIGLDVQLSQYWVNILRNNMLCYPSCKKQQQYRSTGYDAPVCGHGGTTDWQTMRLTGKQTNGWTSRQLDTGINYCALIFLVMGWNVFLFLLYNLFTQFTKWPFINYYSKASLKDNPVINTTPLLRPLCH